MDTSELKDGQAYFALCLKRILRQMGVNLAWRPPSGNPPIFADEFQGMGRRLYESAELLANLVTTEIVQLGAGTLDEDAATLQPGSIEWKADLRSVLAAYESTGSL